MFPHLSADRCCDGWESVIAESKIEARVFADNTLPGRDMVLWVALDYSATEIRFTVHRGVESSALVSEACLALS